MEKLMNTDLRTFSHSELVTLLKFTEALGRLNDKEHEVDFEDPDIDGAKKQAEEYLNRRRAGYRKSEITEDAEIRSGVREWLKRRGKLSRDSS